MTRVVIDTNVVVSGLLFGGLPGRIVDLWKAKHVLPLCSGEMMEEYLRVLAYSKFGLSESEEEIHFLVKHQILPWFDAITVRPGKRFVRADPSDDKFIWCALQGRAKAIISGDEHLLRHKSPPIPILPVQKFLKDQGTF